MRRAVFLDRDGVINRAFVRNGRPYAPTSLKEFEILPGVPESLRLLRKAGFVLVVATNQPDVNKGLTPKEVVESMHQKLLTEFEIDDIQVCYSTDAEKSYRRKPQPGMLTDAAATWNIDLKQSFMVGDRWRDIEAGQAAGCKTIFIDYHYDENHPVSPNYTVYSLAEATQIILKSTDSLK
jgi:D-glycero-D-manno-heptose 1,7-bisphosphate phosphatase